MKIKKNTFSTLVLELFFSSIANCRKLKLQNRLPLLHMFCERLLYGNSAMVEVHVLKSRHSIICLLLMTCKQRETSCLGPVFV
jgi:hypothetical protein